MQSLANLFGSCDEQLDEVDLLPTLISTGSKYEGKYNISEDITQFEYVEMLMGYPQAPSYSMGIIKYDQSFLKVGNNMHWRNVSSEGIQTLNIKIVTTTSIDISYSVTTGAIKDMYVVGLKGYRKRYATKNLSKIINVNGGNPVGVNQRYEIDIASELGSDYLDRDLLVRAEIYYDGSTGGTAGWAESPIRVFQSTTFENCGVLCSVLNGKIVVATGLILARRGTEITAPWGNTTNHIASAPCRVKVWKIDQFVTNTDSQEHARTYPTTWQNVPRGGSGTNLRWRAHSGISVVEGESMWRWLDPETIQVKGIARTSSSPIGQNAVWLYLPTGYVNRFTAQQFLEVGSVSLSKFYNVYGRVDPNANEVTIQVFGDDASQWVMFDWAIAVKKV